MPLFTDVTPITPIIPNEGEKIIIDTASVYSNAQYNPKIIAYIDGSPWATTYYAQYLGEDDVVTNSGDITDPTLKQYYKINQLELRVTTALSSSNVENLGTSVVTGTANVYPIITPIVGDVFIAEIGLGSYGVFEVNTVERASLFKESAWIITYTLIEYATEENITELEHFVVNTAVFDAGMLGTGITPLRTLSENNRALARDVLIANLIDTYYEEFYDLRLKTFLVPDTLVVYDPFIVEFWTMLIDSKHPIPTKYDVRNALVERTYTTVLNAIISQEPSILKRCIKDMQDISVEEFAAAYIRNTVANIGITKVVHPYVSEHLALREADPPFEDGSANYIFSNSFYNGPTPLAPLNEFESLVLRAINRQILAYNDVVDNITACQQLPAIERFYKMPILIVLLRLTR